MYTLQVRPVFQEIQVCVRERKKMCAFEGYMFKKVVTLKTFHTIHFSILHNRFINQHA